MLIWTRWGWLMVLIAFLVCGVTASIVRGIATWVAARTYSVAPEAVTAGIAFVITGALVHVVALTLYARLPAFRTIDVPLEEPYRDESGRAIAFRTVEVLDERTGRPINDRRASTIFFVPVRYWGAILAIGGVGCIIMGLVD